MKTTIHNTTAQQSVAQPTPAAPAAPTAVPVIASRKSCNPDGIGLSHYVLMDRKAAK